MELNTNELLEMNNTDTVMNSTHTFIIIIIITLFISFYFFK